MVTPRHERLQGTAGVKFNVESVSPAEEKDKHKQVLTPDDLRTERMKQTDDFYSPEKDYFSPPSFVPVRIEAESKMPANLVMAGADAFIRTCLTAFARHLPLALKPDHVWALIAYGFARHVDKNAQNLRTKLVSHEGKKRLLVVVDNFIMSGGVKGKGTDAALWERDVFPNFSDQIKAQIGEENHAAIVGEFSTSDCVSKAANEIVLMSALKNYFSYGMMTGCGIPEISLLGTRDDWESLRSKTEKLGALMVPEFAETWLGYLLPVLDEFINSYNGKVNHSFWQSMVKLRTTGGGSGSYDFISGWVQIFYPYLASGKENEKMRPWQEMYFVGPRLDEFPRILSSAPVDWDYYGKTYDLHFHAGFVGMVQNPQNGEVMPELGWYVSHDPPRNPVARLKDVESELADLLSDQGEAAALRTMALRREKELLSMTSELSSRQEKIQSLENKQFKVKSEEERNRNLAQLRRLEREQCEAARKFREYDN